MKSPNQEEKKMAGNLIGSRKGAAMVELAIILPILFVVLFGIIEFGLILYDKALITNASREGARQGIVFRWDVATDTYDPYTESQIQGVVNAYLSGRLISSITAAPVTNVPGGICTGAGAQLTVRVTYNYNFFVLPNFITSITGPLNLVAETIMRCE
jgi:Flp pilus assembly protein TadG